MTLTRSVDTSLPLGKFIALSVDEFRRENDGRLAGEELYKAIERFDREWHAARGDEAKATSVSLKDRRALSDALARVCGLDPRQMTKTEGRTCGTRMAEIIRVMPTVTEGELSRRAAKYMTLFPGMTITPARLANAWSACGHTELPKAPGFNPGYNLAVEPASEWRAVAQDIVGDCPLAEWIRDGQEWPLVPREIRLKVLEVLRK